MAAKIKYLLIFPFIAACATQGEVAVYKKEIARLNHIVAQQKRKIEKLSPPKIENPNRTVCIIMEEDNETICIRFDQ